MNGKTLAFLLVAGVAAAQSRKLDTTTFVVVGEGLAAGQADFGLNEVYQRFSFPSLMARQMGAIMPQPLIQGPGVHDVLGEPAQSLQPPYFGTGAVRFQVRATPASDPSPPLFVFNISVPNARLADALTRRPSHPLVNPTDRQQTAINLLLGFPQLLFGVDVPLWTQAEYGAAMNPSLAIVELGYFDALDAAVRQTPGELPAGSAFGASYARVVEGLRSRFAEVIVTTIPDPFDTAFFSTPEYAASLNRTPLADLLSGFGLRADDRITRQGLNEIGFRLVSRNPAPLDRAMVVPATVAAEIRARVRAYNEEIRGVATRTGAQVYDLNALFTRVRADGVQVGATRLSANYLGRFYSLDGYYPGRTGQAIIANELLNFLNQTYRASFPLVDTAAVLAGDPVASHRGIAGGVQ